MYNVTQKGRKVDDQYYDLDETPIVLMTEEGVMAVVREYGPEFSRVVYHLGGIEFDEWRENDDFVVIDNIIFKHVVEE